MLCYEMETVTISKEIFSKILLDAEVLMKDVEMALDTKVKQRISDIEENKVEGKSEKELDDYLKSRGVKIE